MPAAFPRARFSFLKIQERSSTRQREEVFQMDGQTLFFSLLVLDHHKTKPVHIEGRDDSFSKTFPLAE